MVDTREHIVLVNTDQVARAIVRGENGVKPGRHYRFTNADYERIAEIRHALDDIARHLGFDEDALIGGQAVELMDLWNEVRV